MPRSSSRFILAALLVGWAVDFFFYNKTIGISFLLWTALVLAAVGFCAYGERVRPARASYVLMAAVLLLALVPFVRREPFSILMAVVLALGALILLAATLRSGHWLYFRTWDTLLAGILVLFNAVVRPFDLRKSRVEIGVEGGEPAAKGKGARRQVYAVLRGLLLALPLVVILGALLASADIVFADRMRDLLVVFQLERLPEYIFRLFYILVLAFGFSGALLHAVLPKKESEHPNPARPLLKPFLGWTETVVVLVSVNALFLFFVILQFQYLFGGQANITTAGYTYSEYARRGFSELVMVALISLALYLALGTAAQRETQARARSFQGLTILLMGLVLVILGSALQRLVLYEQAYGFTRLRTYTFIFIPWLAVLLLTTIALEVSGRSYRFGLALLLVVLGFGLTFGVLNLDGFITRQNVQRALSGEELDGAYLSTLSSDAVPALYGFYAQPDLDPAVRAVLGAELACRAAGLQDDAARPWQAFTYSEARASRILSQNAAAWADYRVTKDTAGWWQVTAVGQTRRCSWYAPLD